MELGLGDLYQSGLGQFGDGGIHGSDIKRGDAPRFGGSAWQVVWGIVCGIGLQ